MCSMRQVRDRHGDRKLITDHVKDSVKSVLIFYYVGNINLNRRTKNTHKMGMGNFKESAGMLKNTL